jgi:hypothetical protein
MTIYLDGAVKKSETQTAVAATLAEELQRKGKSPEAGSKPSDAGPASGP